MEMDEKSVAVVNEVISNHIPDDIAFSILSKLPLKSLKRFGGVRKSWTLLFENSHFMSLYRNNFTYTSLLLKQHETLPNGQYNTLLYLLSGESVENRVSLDSPPPFQDLNNYYIVLGSSANGVLCVVNGRESSALWNPATKEFKVIPPSPVEFGPPCRDPWPELYGFGYDHVRDDYKVIRHVHFFESGEAKRYGMTYDVACDEDIDFMPLWEIYSLRSNSWKKLDFEMPDDPSYGEVGRQTYSEGVCHWWGSNEPNVVSCLVSFVMSNEVFFTTPMPSYMGDVSFDYCFMVHLAMLNGYVAFICNHTEKTTFHISILGELGVKESWTKLFVIGPFPCVENLIGLGNNGNIFFKTKDGELAWFDWSTQMIVELGIKDPGKHSQVLIGKVSYEFGFFEINFCSPKPMLFRDFSATHCWSITLQE